MNNDQDIIMILLELEKDMVKNYATAITEASSDTLTERLCDLFNMSMNAQRDLFDLANSKGWYQLEYAEINKLNTAEKKLTNKLSNMGGQAQ